MSGPSDDCGPPREAYLAMATLLFLLLLLWYSQLSILMASSAVFPLLTIAAMAMGHLHRILMLEDISAYGHAPGSGLHGPLYHLQELHVRLSLRPSGYDHWDWTAFHHRAKGIDIPGIIGLDDICSQFRPGPGGMGHHLHIVGIGYPLAPGGTSWPQAACLRSHISRSHIPGWRAGRIRSLSLC